MKKIAYIVLGIWSAIACFLSPVWLNMVFLNLSGLIYQYDYTMDEGTAVVLGLIMMFIWLLLVLLPMIIFLKRMYMLGSKALAGSILGMIIMVTLCMAMCGWDVTGYVMNGFGIW